MEQTETSPEQRLELIAKMIDSSRQQIKDDGRFWLLWGFATLLAATTQLVLISWKNYEFHWVSWPVVMTAAGIISGIMGSRMSKKQKVYTYFNRFIFYLWTSFIASFGMFIILPITGALAYTQSYPLFILFYGLATFITGGLLKFKPLIFGGIIAWIISFVAFYQSFEIQLILLILSILVSYIVPGFMLRAKS